MSVYKMSYPILYLMVICGLTTSMCLQTACSLLQLAKWSLPGKAEERRGRGSVGALVLLVGGCSRNYHPFTVTACSCPRPPGSRLTLQRPFALGELFIHQTGRLATGQLMILPPQWDTLSLSAVTLEGEDRYIRSQS